MSANSAPVRARLSHHAHGRTRIRLASKKGDHAYFETLKKTFSCCEAIETFEVNPVLGTILLLHELDLEEIAAWLHKHGIQLHAEGPRRPVRPLREQVLSGVEAVDQELADRTEGNVDLGSLAFLGLVSLGTAQLLRGQVLSPATTLFQMAMNALSWSASRRPRKTGA